MCPALPAKTYLKFRFPARSRRRFPASNVKTHTYIQQFIKWAWPQLQMWPFSGGVGRRGGGGVGIRLRWCTSNITTFQDLSLLSCRLSRDHFDYTIPGPDQGVKYAYLVPAGTKIFQPDENTISLSKQIDP